MKIDLQDETNRIGVLSQLPGMELQAMTPELQKAGALNDAQMAEQARGLDVGKYNADQGLNVAKYNADQNVNADKFNIQSAMGEKLQERGFDSNTYNQLMKTWAAGQTADATASSQPSGMCFITTAVCDYLGLPDDNPILNAFRKFRDEQMGGKENLKTYYEIAPKIVEKIKGDAQELNRIICAYLLPAYIKIESGFVMEVEKIYTDMVNELAMKHLNQEEIK